MAYSRGYTIVPSNSDGGALPPRGATGKYLWEDSRTFAANQIQDEKAHPGQSIIIREQVQLFYDIYEPALIAKNLQQWEPTYRLGTWQAIRRGTVNQPLISGESENLVTTIMYDHVFTAGYKIEDGFTNYGIGTIRQCNFSLEPTTPISFEILGVEVNFAGYDIPGGSGALFTTQFSSDRHYPRNDRNFQLILGKLGTYTYPGAALAEVGYSVRQVNNLPGENFPFPNPTCLRG